MADDDRQRGLRESHLFDRETEELTAMFFTQLLPSSTYPIRSHFSREPIASTSVTRN